MAAPEVSVVVPARDAQGTLGATLAALAAQEYAGAWELLVVDDASSDGTAALARAAGARVVALERQVGPAGARNAGLAATAAPLVLFTDADCAPAPGWLAEMAAALAGADIVTGPVRPDPTAPRGPFDRTLDVPAGSLRFETANLGVRRETALRVGGFTAFAPHPDAPPGLRPRVEEGHFGEDVVFGWRAVRAGARARAAPGAVVHHAVFARGPGAYVAERWRLRFFPALVREVPELRGRLPLRVFLAPRTALFDLAAAGLATALARRRLWPLALALPYARRCLRTRAALTRGGLRENAVLVAGDAVGLAALVRGSAAARRLLL